MPPKAAPKCAECQATESNYWTTISGIQICHNCWEKKQNDMKTDIEDESKIEAEEFEERKLRKSTRSTRYRAAKPAQLSNPSNAVSKGADGNTGKDSTVINTNTGAVANNGVNNNTSTKSQLKSRSRRHIFKKAPVKLAIQYSAETHSVESVTHKGTYMQVGDIVSLVDADNNVYYAQIRGLLIDAYSEKSAFLTWLIPTKCSPDPKQGFDPATYLIGPDEDFSRKLSYLEFVMHAPSNYYHDRTTPFPLPDSMCLPEKTGGYIWANLTEFNRS